MGENAPKIVIVVLVIVVVLFFVGIGVGAGGQNKGQGGLPNISIDSAINTFSGLIPVPAVALNEITKATPSNCFAVLPPPQGPSIIVSVLAGCKLDIKDSGSNIRALKLKLADNQRVHIESTSDPVKDKPMLSKLDLPSQNSAQVTLNFFQTNSSVTFSDCVPETGNSCTLTIVS